MQECAKRGQGLLALIDITMKFDGVNALLKASWKIYSRDMKHNSISE